MKRAYQDENKVSLNLLQHLLDQSGDAFFAVQARDGRILFVNDQACQHLGCDRDTLVGYRASDFSAELKHADWPVLVGACRQAKQLVFETELEGPDGERRSVEVSVRYVDFDAEAYLIGVVRDIGRRKCTDAALLDGEQKFRALVEYSQAGVYLIQQEKIRYANPQLAYLFGYGTEDLIDKPMADLVHPDDLAFVREKLRQRESGKLQTTHYGFRARRRNGSFFQVEVYTCTVDNQGEPATIGTLLDVTDRKKVEDDLRESEERLRLSQAYGGIGIWEADLTGNRLIWSEECSVLNGFPRSYQPSWEEFMAAVHPEDRQTILDARKAHLRFGAPYDVEYRIQSGKGLIRWMRSVGHAEYDAERIPVRMRGVAQDITRLHEVVEELKKSESRLKEAQHLAHVGDWELDLDTRQFRCSDEAFRIFEIDKERVAMSFEAFLEAVHPEDREAVDRGFRTSVAERTPLSIDHRLMFPDGRIKFVHQQCETLYDQSGRPLKSLGTIQDISVRKQTEAERQYFYDTLNASLNEIYIFKADTLLFEFVSQGALKNLGYSMTEMRNMTPLDLKPEFNQDSFSQLLKPLFEVRVPVLRFETEHRRADGSHYPVEVHLQMIDQIGHRVFLAVILDITERRMAEKKLRENEARFRLTLKAAQQGWYDFDVQTGEAKVSTEYAEILGYDPETFIENQEKWIERMHPDDRQAVLSNLQAYLEGQVPEYRVEFRQRTRDGHWKWLISIGSIVERDGQGRPLRMLGTHRDITERKSAELAVRKLNEELEARVMERTEQLQAANQELETFTYTVSHDLKAPLRGIDGYSRLLQDEYAGHLEGECSRFIENIRKGVRQMNELIEDLLVYSRLERRTLNTVQVRITSLIEQIRLEKQTDLEKSRARITVELPEDLMVRADFNGLSMVLRNLFDNALKFTRNAEPPTLEVSGKVQGESCIIWFRDNGIGFDMKYHDRIFEIFQRLQRAEDYPGTGIGLTIVRKAMQRMGGRIWAESAPGQGATFYLELPL